MQSLCKATFTTLFCLCFCLQAKCQTGQANSLSLIPDSTQSSQDNTSLTYNQRTNQAAILSNDSNALRAAGNLQEARAKLEQASLLDPNQNSAIVHSNLGLTLLQIGQIDLARTEFFKALSFNSDMPAALYSIASSYFQQRNVEQAKYYLQDFLNKYPNAETSDAARRMLVSLQNVTRLNDDPNASDYYASAVTNRITIWPPEKQPLTVFIESGKHVDGYQPSFKDDLMTAFDKWMDACNHQLSWQLTSKKKKADIVCHWASDKHNFQEPDGAELGQTLVRSLSDPKRGNRYFIKKVDMILCTKNLDGITVLNDEQVDYLCLHEIGHALGIKSHSSNSNDVMFFMMKNPVSANLSDRDKATILRLYSY